MRGKKKEKYQIILSLSQEFTLAVLFKISKTNRASYYKWLNGKPEDLTVEELIIRHFTKYRKRQGVIKLKQSLFFEHKLVVNHKKIRRVLRSKGLVCPIRRKKFKKEPAFDQTYQDNILNRDFKPDKPNIRLATDFTYLTVQGTTYFLSVVLDLFDNYPLIWYITDSCDKTLSLNTIDLLSEKMDLKGCLFHSDRGVQYTCRTFVERLKEEGVIQSMSRSGNCWDNAVMENFFGILKTETIYLEPARARTLDSLTELLAEGFDYYINHRPITALGGVPPAEYRRNYCPA